MVSLSVSQTGGAHCVTNEVVSGVLMENRDMLTDPVVLMRRGRGRGLEGKGFGGKGFGEREGFGEGEG